MRYLLFLFLTLSLSHELTAQLAGPVYALASGGLSIPVVITIDSSGTAGGRTITITTPGGDGVTWRDQGTGSGAESIDGVKTFTSDPLLPDEAYDATAWNGSLEPPTKNAVRDKIESMSAGGLTFQQSLAISSLRL